MGVVWLPGLIAADCRLELYFYFWSGHCLFVYSISWSLLLTILSFPGGWWIQGKPKIQIFTAWSLLSCLHGQLYCKIFLPFLLYHHGDHLGSFPLALWVGQRPPVYRCSPLNQSRRMRRSMHACPVNIGKSSPPSPPGARPLQCTGGSWMPQPLRTRKPFGGPWAFWPRVWARSGVAHPHSPVLGQTQAQVAGICGGCTCCRTDEPRDAHCGFDLHFPNDL